MQRFSTLAVLLLSLFSLLCSAHTVTAQHLPDLATKPKPKFEPHSFCPPEGRIVSVRDDPDLNKHKNRVDDATKYYAVDFDEIKTLDYPKETSGVKRSNWTKDQTDAVAKYEGIPVEVKGYLALVNNPGKNHKNEGARPESKESCNCGKTDAAHIDFHIWLLNAAGDSRKEAIVVEMTPRVRAHHPAWTVAQLTNLARHHYQVRVSGWLMMDEQHPEQVGGTRATLWEVHPIIKFEYKQGTKWKTL